jgi:hypothetical protein
MIIVRKRRTREHVIVDLSVNFVERQVLLYGDTLQRVGPDYGYDLFLFSHNNAGEQEPGEIRVQLKASDTPRILKTGSAISFPVLRSDLALWLFEPMPVLLIFYDAQADAAYWLYIQQYFEAITGFNLFAAPASVSVRIPAASVLDRDAIRLFS